MPPIFVCPKEGARKGHLTVPALRATWSLLPLLVGVLLTVDRTLETHSLRRLRQVQLHFSITAAMLCGTERVYYLKSKFFAVSRRRAAQQRAEQRLGGAQRLSDVARSL